MSLSEALPTTAIDTVSEFTRRSATGNCISEGLAQGSDMAARAGFGSTTLRSRGVVSTNAPPCMPHITVIYSCELGIHEGTELFDSGGSLHKIFEREVKITQLLVLLLKNLLRTIRVIVIRAILSTTLQSSSSSMEFALAACLPLHLPLTNLPTNGPASPLNNFKNDFPLYQRSAPESAGCLCSALRFTLHVRASLQSFGCSAHSVTNYATSFNFPQSLPCRRDYI